MKEFRDKISDRERALKTIDIWRTAGEKIVFTNGCFDIVHLGHVDYLEKARKKGDRLVVGVNTDASVQRIKGKDRPVVNEYSRAAVIASFEFVDMVVFFDEDTPLELIEKLKPDILVKGNDYMAEKIIGAKFVEENGGKVETLPLVEGYSTSSIIDKIKQENKLKKG